MPQENLNLGTADNAHDGDTVRAAFQKAENNFTEVYADVAALEATEATQNTDISRRSKVSWFDDNDVGTTITPISHTGLATGTYLTNDSAGSFTNQYNPDSLTRPWSTVNQNFSWSQFKIGDYVKFRVDVDVTTTAANQEFSFYMSLGEGESPYELRMHKEYRKNASLDQVTFVFEIYIGDSSTRDGTARIRFASDNNATITVNGWYCRVGEV